MTRTKVISKYALAIFMLIAGTMHFANRSYFKILCRKLISS